MSAIRQIICAKEETAARDASGKQEYEVLDETLHIVNTSLNNALILSQPQKLVKILEAFTIIFRFFNKNRLKKHNNL